MRHPHPDPDQAPLTACTGRVSHDRTIESQLRIGPIPSFSSGMVNATNGLPCETRPQPAFSPLTSSRPRNVCHLRVRRDVCMKHRAGQPGSPGTERHGARAPPREAFSL